MKKRSLITLALLIAAVMLTLGFDLRPELCALVDTTPWGYPVILNDNSLAFRRKPADLTPFDFYYIDQGKNLPLAYINHYSESANEMWVLPLRDLRDSGVQGRNDLCIRRVYTVAE